MKNIYGKTNRYKTKESRYYLLGLYRNRLLKLLQEGYSPFQDNTDHHIKKRHKDKETAMIGDRPIAPESKKKRKFNHGFLFKFYFFDKFYYGV
jgi:uncharacterized protein YueI